MSTILVTGATGLIGSVIAQQLRAGGHEVRALVRQGTDASPIEALGVQVARGDVTDTPSLRPALDGCDGAIHSAAIVGLPSQDAAISHAVNVDGSMALLDAARAVGAGRVVMLSTAACFDARTSTLTEESPIDSTPATDPYTITKKKAFEEASKRIADGQDIVFVLPGATYGPSPMGRRMVEIPGANQRIVRMLRGEPAEYVPASAPWSFTEDVAACSIAALDRGKSGDRFLSLGPTGASMSFAGFVNRAAELAGVDNRVGEVDPSRLGDPDVLATFGPTLVSMAKRQYAKPFFDDTRTQQVLGVTPVPTDEAIARTVAWLRNSNLV